MPRKKKSKIPSTKELCAELKTLARKSPINAKIVGKLCVFYKFLMENANDEDMKRFMAHKSESAFIRAQADFAFDKLKELLAAIYTVRKISEVMVNTKKRKRPVRNIPK